MAALVGNHHRKDRKFGELPGLNNPRQRRAKPEREGVETIIDPSRRDDGIVQTTNGENRRRKTKWDVIRVSLDRSQHRAPLSHPRPPDNRHHSQPVTSVFSMVRKFDLQRSSVQIEG